MLLLEADALGWDAICDLILALGEQASGTSASTANGLGRLQILLSCVYF